MSDMSEMIAELPEPATPTGIRYGWHDRYRIPLDHPAALRFYLNNLFVPHSRREMLWALVARTSSLAGRAAVPVLRVDATNLSGRKTGAPETDDGGALEGSLQTGEAGIEFLSSKLENHLRRAGVAVSEPLSFLSLDDYRHAGRQKMVLFIFDRTADRPCAVAKIGSETRHGAVLAHEHGKMLALNGRVDEELRRTMPRPLALFGDSGLQILLESFIGGRSLYFEMRNSWRPRTLAARHFRLAGEWVVRFQRATQIRVAQLDGEIATEHVLRPLEEFQRLCAPAPEERELIAQVKLLTEGLKDERLPIVARQGDFWARNLILQGDSIGVVDWESFKEQSAPFTDLFLFATSYALSYPWRLGRWAEPCVAFAPHTLSRVGSHNSCASVCSLTASEMEVSPQLLEIFFPVFLAERALEEKRQLDERNARKDETGVARRTKRRKASGEARSSLEGGTWRQLFQEYARRTGPACFG
jgi:hypothetical protein